MNSPPGKLRGQAQLGVVLAMIAGYVDGFGFLTFNTYLSFMSGNTTQAGCSAGRGDFKSAVPVAMAIIFFVVGIVGGTLLRQAGWRRSRQIILIEAGAMLAAVVGGTQLGWFPDNVRIGAISLAMGALNTAISRIGNEPLNIAFVTGTLNKLGNHLAMALLRVPPTDSQGPWDTRLRRAGLLASVWAAFFFGAVLAGMAMSRLAGWTLLPPAIILFILALIPDDVG